MAQVHFEDGCGAQAHQFAIALGKELLCVVVIRESLFERRGRQPVTDAAREIAEIQALAGGIDWP